jgi:hypothetical protein
MMIGDAASVSCSPRSPGTWPRCLSCWASWPSAASYSRAVPSWASLARYGHAMVRVGRRSGRREPGGELRRPWTESRRRSPRRSARTDAARRDYDDPDGGLPPATRPRLRAIDCATTTCPRSPGFAMVVPGSIPSRGTRNRHRKDDQGVRTSPDSHGLHPRRVAQVPQFACGLRLRLSV